jgi:hypothetical protein
VESGFSAKVTRFRDKTMTAKRPMFLWKAIKETEELPTIKLQTSLAEQLR